MNNTVLQVDEITSELNKYIGLRIGRLRTRLKYSYAYVGNKIGRSGELVRQVENASTAPSPSTLAAIASVLKVDISYFFEGFQFSKDDIAKDEQLKKIEDYILSIDDINITISTDATLSLKRTKSKPDFEQKDE